MLKYEEMNDEEKEERLTEIFEAAVRATHHFYKEEDIINLKESVRSDLCDAYTIVELDEDGYIAAFISLFGIYVHLLYVHPDYFGQGYGSSLLQKAVEEHHAECLCVLEQNERALKFYEKRGFVFDSRIVKTGNEMEPYPLLQMRLENPAQTFIEIKEKTRRYNKLLKMGDCSLEKNSDYLDSCNMFALEKDGQAIGVATVNACGRIMNFAVLPKFRKQHYGALMMYFLKKHYQDKFRWLRIAVSGNNVPFLKLHCFKREDSIRNYYRNQYPKSRRIHRKRYDPWDLVMMKCRIGK